MFMSSGYSEQTRSVPELATEHHHHAADVLVGRPDERARLDREALAAGLGLELVDLHDVEMDDVHLVLVLAPRALDLAEALDHDAAVLLALHHGLAGEAAAVLLGDV